MPDIEEREVGKVQIAEFSSAFGGIVDLVEMVCMERCVLLLKEVQAMMKMVRAKMAVRMVQQQSVHCRSFSSTGRFLNM